uniref:Clu domain-containing protein n=1 Tax=Arcella intermedia TaxID=1963864 RepID=A0A6B2KW71_9EUKA
MIDLPEINSEDMCTKYQSIAKLAKDFEETALTYGVIIIKETYLPVELKSIKPVNVGGIAGGEKYIFHGIFFKFATNQKNIYDSEESAQKAAAHDLRGLLNHNKFPNLRVRYPMMVIIDYLGMRLVAMSILPVGDTTLVYGSCDGGKSIHKSDPVVNKHMKWLAKQLNLKKHFTGKDQKTSLYGPGDIEVHTGTDGRYYVLDFHRTFPPEPTTSLWNSKQKDSFLVNLLRPELVLQSPHPLSSDVFSAFGSHDREIHNSEVERIHEKLLNEVIPKFGESLSSKSFGNLIDVGLFQELIQSIHSNGINVRYLGMIRNHTQNSEWRAIILIEMIVRAFKSIIEDKLRIKMKELSSLAIHPYIEIYAQNLNMLVARSPEADVFWKKTLKEVIIKKFVSPCLSNEELNEGFDLRSIIQESLIPLMFLQCCNKLGVMIQSQRAKEALLSDCYSFTLLGTDIKFNPTIKSTNTILLCDAVSTGIIAKNYSVKTGMRLIQVTENLFEKLYANTPFNPYAQKLHFGILTSYTFLSPWLISDRIEFLKRAHHIALQGRLNHCVFQIGSFVAHKLIPSDDFASKNELFSMAKECLESCDVPESTLELCIIYSKWASLHRFTNPKLAEQLLNQLYKTVKNISPDLLVTSKITRQKAEELIKELNGKSIWSLLCDKLTPGQIHVVDKQVIEDKIHYNSLLVSTLIKGCVHHLVARKEYWMLDALETFFIKFPQRIKGLILSRYPKRLDPFFKNNIKSSSIKTLNLKESFVSVDVLTTSLQQWCIYLKKLILDKVQWNINPILFLFTSTSKLEILSVKQTNINDQALSNFLSSNIKTLKVLKITDCKNLSPTSTNLLLRYDQLQMLHVSCSSISNEFLSQYLSKNSSLESLHLKGDKGDCDLISESVFDLITSCSRLNSLKLPDCSQISLQKLLLFPTTLLKLSINHSPIDNQTFTQLLEKHSNLVSCSTERCPNVTSHSLSHLSDNFTSLKKLRLEFYEHLDMNVLWALPDRLQSLSLKILNQEKNSKSTDKESLVSMVPQMQAFKTTYFRYLDLHIPALDDETFNHIAQNSPFLEVLKIVGSSCLSHPVISSNNLNVLILKDCISLESDAISKISLDCPNIFKLKVVNCKLLSNISIHNERLNYFGWKNGKLEENQFYDMLKKCDQLQTLKLEGCDNGTFNKFSRDFFSNLLELSIENSPNLSSDFLKPTLNNCTNLLHLTMRKIEIKELFGLPNLSILDLAQNTITENQILSALSSNSQLQKMNLQGCSGLSPTFLNHLTTLHPSTLISL